jgi:hypothetical protein
MHLILSEQLDVIVYKCVQLLIHLPEDGCYLVVYGSQGQPAKEQLG